MPNRHRQLALIEVAPFAGGPARLPRPARTPRVTPASLPLPFGPRPPKPPPLRSFTKGSSPEKRPPRPDAPRVERVLVGARPLDAAGRGRLEDALHSALGAEPQRRGGLVCTSEEDRLELHLEPGLLRAVFLGAGALSRWLVALQRVGREHGLVEPE